MKSLALAVALVLGSFFALDANADHRGRNADVFIRRGNVVLQVRNGRVVSVQNLNRHRRNDADVFVVDRFGRVQSLNRSRVFVDRFGRVQVLR